MYAYKQTGYAQRNLHVVPDRRVVGRAKKPSVNIKRVQKRVGKTNSLVYFIRSMITILCLSSFMFFVCPSCFTKLIKNVLFPPNVKITTSQVGNLAQLKPQNIQSADLYSILNPTVNYVHNDMFMNRLLLTPTLEKKHSEITTMYHTAEMTGLKKQIYGLMAQYPSIKPAIYVWEYENGKYIDINGDKSYSAASIIKLPILVRLFKSIEAKQLTIYDEMTLTNYYKALGSGDLQYAPTGKKYSIDELAKTMIQNSDNSSTNMIMSKLGGMDDINVGLRDWGISKTYVRTWLPDLGGTNKTTAQDMAKLLYNLDNPGFLNINSREYIIDYMSHVKNNRLIAAGLGDGALFIHKTGDIGTMLGDAGIVYAKNGKKYIVVILANRPYNSSQGKEFIVKASNLIYKAVVE